MLCKLFLDGALYPQLFHISCIVHLLCSNIGKLDHIIRTLSKKFDHKVEKILKGSLDLIPSPTPSVKIQIMGWKVCIRAFTSHSAYVATATESVGVKIDGLLLPNFL